MASERANALHSKVHKVKAEELESAKRALMEKLEKQYGDKFESIRGANMGILWRSFVTCRADAEAMMEIMYPHLPKQVEQAYVHMFERAIRGEIELDERLVNKSGVAAGGSESTVWDPVKDIEAQKMEGLINLQEKRLQDLLNDEEGNLKEKIRK